MLSGLDGVAWKALHHAYGPADDLPAAIRAAASTDEQEADAAVEALFSSVFHQGTVYPASVAVVPFVAELAVTSAVHHRHLLVYLLGGMADPRQAHGPDVAAVGSALTAQVPRLLPLLADPDPKVREAAAYTLAQCPEMAGLVVARLRQRWPVEDVALVRASLLAAGGRLDPAGCGRWLSAALDDRQAAVRAAAALAIVRAGLAAGDQPAGTAASLAAELGAHARPLVPLLRRTLDEPWASVRAADALWRLGEDSAGLIEPVVAAVADCWGGGEVALELLVQMRATQAVPRLRELAEQDARIVTSGIDDEIVGRDERLRARLWQAIKHL
jgi:HEAT repeat